MESITLRSNQDRYNITLESPTLNFIGTPFLSIKCIAKDSQPILFKSVPLTNAYINRTLFDIENIESAQNNGNNGSNGSNRNNGNVEDSMMYLKKLCWDCEGIDVKFSSIQILNAVLEQNPREDMNLSSGSNKSNISSDLSNDTNSNNTNEIKVVNSLKMQEIIRNAIQQENASSHVIQGKLQSSPTSHYHSFSILTLNLKNGQKIYIPLRLTDQNSLDKRLETMEDIIKLMGLENNRLSSDNFALKQENDILKRRVAQIEENIRLLIYNQPSHFLSNQDLSTDSIQLPSINFSGRESPKKLNLSRPHSSSGVYGRDSKSKFRTERGVYSAKQSPFPTVKPSKSRYNALSPQSPQPQSLQLNVSSPSNLNSPSFQPSSNLFSSPSASNSANALSPHSTPSAYSRSPSVSSRSADHESAYIDLSNTLPEVLHPQYSNQNTNDSQSRVSTSPYRSRSVSPRRVNLFQSMRDDEIQYLLFFLNIRDILEMSLLNWRFYKLVNDNRFWKKLVALHFIDRSTTIHETWKMEYYIFYKFLQWHPTDHSKYINIIPSKSGYTAEFPSIKYCRDDSQPFVSRLKNPIPPQGIFELELIRGSTWHNTGIGIATEDLLHHAFSWNNKPFNICIDGHHLIHSNRDDIDFLPMKDLGNIWGDYNNVLGSYISVQNPPKKARLSKSVILPSASYLQMLNIGLVDNSLICMGIKFETGVRIKKGDSVIIRIDNNARMTKPKSGCWMLSTTGVGSISFYVNRKQVGLSIVNIFNKPREKYAVYVVANIGDGGFTLSNGTHSL